MQSLLTDLPRLVERSRLVLGEVVPLAHPTVRPDPRPSGMGGSGAATGGRRAAAAEVLAGPVTARLEHGAAGGGTRSRALAEGAEERNAGEQVAERVGGWVGVRERRFVAEEEREGVRGLSPALKKFGKSCRGRRGDRPSHRSPRTRQRKLWVWRRRRAEARTARDPRRGPKPSLRPLEEQRGVSPRPLDVRRPLRAFSRASAAPSRRLFPLPPPTSGPPTDPFPFPSRSLRSPPRRPRRRPSSKVPSAATPRRTTTESSTRPSSRSFWSLQAPTAVPAPRRRCVGGGGAQRPRGGGRRDRRGASRQGRCRTVRVFGALASGCAGAGRWTRLRRAHGSRLNPAFPSPPAPPLPFHPAQAPKKRRAVDRRASKGRKIRYNVNEKLVNFMAPEDDGTSELTEQLFRNLFGGGTV